LTCQRIIVASLRGLVFVLLATLLVAAPARAGTATAREHYVRGTKLFDLGKYKEAAEEYELAYQEKDDPALLYNIAQAYRLAGDNESALRAYRGYLRRQPTTPNRAEVEGRISELQATIEQQRRAREKQPNDVLPSTEKASEPPPVVAAAPVAAPPAPEYAPARTKKLAGIGVGVGGVALLGLGGAFVGLAKSANDNIAPGGKFDYSQETRRNSFEAADAVCFTVGGVALAAGVVLYVLGVREARLHRPTVSAASAWGVGF
jgi:tetratricopeptide (TPR) repeat protein